MNSTAPWPTTPDLYTIVEVPVGAGTGEFQVGEFKALELQFNGVAHGKRMVNGHVTRAPAENFLYLRADDPMLSWLGQRRPLEPEAVANQLRQRTDDWPLGYIVIHRDLLGDDNNTFQEIVGYLNQQGDLLCPPLIEGDGVAYPARGRPTCAPRTPPQNAEGAYVIDIGAPTDAAYLGWGWHYAEDVAGLSVRWTGDWADLVFGIENWRPGQHRYADLVFDLPPGAYDMTLTAQALGEARTVTPILNGEPLDSLVISAETLADYTIELPADLVTDGDNVTLRLACDDLVDAGPRRVALMIDRLTFTPRQP